MRLRQETAPPRLATPSHLRGSRLQFPHSPQYPRLSSLPRLHRTGKELYAHRSPDARRCHPGRPRHGPGNHHARRSSSASSSGADKKMARWDKIVEYYGVLEKQSSGRMKVVNMGPTSEGNPFLMVIITVARQHGQARPSARSQPAHQRSARPHRSAGARAGRRGQGRRRAVDEHARHRDRRHADGARNWPTICSPARTKRRGAFSTTSSSSRCPASIRTARSWSPTGTTRQLGTPYEGTNPPWLYQKYAGHDNNRDAFQTNIPDSQYMAKILFTDWKPEAYVDHHHMGANGARIFLPPYAEPDPPVRRSACSGAS